MAKEIIEGTYKVTDGKLSFTCKTQGVTFDQVRSALTLLKEEIERQLAMQANCPYHNVPGIISSKKIRDIKQS
jgi:hypothetical protein